MKKSFKKIFNIVIYISFIISIIGNIIVNRNNILNNNTKILKEMSESTQLTDLNNTLNALQTSHTEYANHIQTSKQKIANAINMYPNNNATENNSLEELSTMITNLTNVPENTYFYQSGTEGDSATIVRYKKINEKYYICDSNGVVAKGASASDVSNLTLIPYSATSAGNLSAGSAGYAFGHFYLGDGYDNATYLTEHTPEIGYHQIIYLGNGTTFDVKQYYDDYANLSVDDFVVELSSTVTANTSTANKGGSGAYLVSSNSCSSSSSMYKTYDSSTGILTAYINSSAYINIVYYHQSEGWTVSKPASNSVNGSVKAYLII